MWLTRLAINRPITVVMILVSILLLGGISFYHLPLAFLPHAEFPFIGIFIPYPNGIPGQVEKDIARPLEEVLATLGGVKETFSQSDADQCFVGVMFDWGRDVNALRLEVKEKVDQIRPELPADIRQILLFTFNTNDIPIVEGRISAKDRDLAGSYDLIEHRVVNRLKRVPGVGQVNIDGVQPADVSVYLKLDKIKEYQVDVGSMFTELSSSNFNLTVGQITETGLRYDLRALAPIKTLKDIEELPINDRGLKLRDIADVVYASPEAEFGRFLNMEPAVAFWIQKASGFNTVEVVRGIKEELAKINHDPSLEGIETLMFFDQAEQITHSLRGLLTAGFIGAGLAILVLYFFLVRLGTTLIVSLAIPISIIGTAVFMYFTGRSLNVLSMMGLMLAVGMLIDNAVVVLESIYQRMDKGEDPIPATISGTRDVGRAVVSATLTSIIVFAPIVFGRQSEIVVWLGEVGLTVSVTLVLSLLVSLTIIPLLTTHMLKGRERSVGHNPWVDKWRDKYSKVLEWTAIRHPWVTGTGLMAAVLAITAGAIAVTGFKPDIMGEEGLRHKFLRVRYEFSDSPDYRRTRDYVNRIQGILWPKKEELGIKYIYSWYGDDFAGTRLYFEKETLNEKDLAAYRDTLRTLLPEMAGIKISYGDEDGSGSGAEQFAVTVYGEDSELLQGLSAEVKRRLEHISGVNDLSTDIERGGREVQVMVDGNLTDKYQTSPLNVAQLMGITFRGMQLPKFHAQGKEVDLWVSLRPEDRANLKDLKSLTVNTIGDKDITLDQVATTVMTRGPTRIQRLNQRTAVEVNGSYEGEEFSDVLDEIKATMANMHFPPGYGWNFGSEIQEKQQNQSDMGVNALLALICVYMVMACLFESLIHPLVVMSCVPFASIGVIWLMIVTGTPFNLMAMIGMVILIGVIVNNGIVLIDHINHYRKQGYSLEDAIRLGGKERFRPILMTASSTILGLIPLAVGDGHVGNAEMYPMARAMIGGLASGTVLTLIVLPTYYQLAERLRARVLRMFPWMGRLGSKLRFRKRRGAARPALEEA